MCSPILSSTKREARAPQIIEDRAGHKDYNTTRRYVREAETLVDTFGDVFSALPALTGGTDEFRAPFVRAATAAELRAAIANVTRALATVSSSEHVLDLVRGRNTAWTSAVARTWSVRRTREV